MTYNIPNLAFSSREFLRMIESFGLSGNWGWHFARNEYIWSSGMYKLFGIEDGSVQPDYELFRSLVHPEDRAKLEDAGQILHEGILGNHTFRIVRPDGTMRMVLSRGDVYFTPDGAPAGAAGVVLDITNQQRAALAVRVHNDRQRAVFEHGMIVPWVWTGDGQALHAPGWCELTGIAPEDLQRDWHAPIEDRAAILQKFAEARERGEASSLDFAAKLADGNRVALRALMVPVSNGGGPVREWTGLTFPPTSATPEPKRQPLAPGNEQLVRGLHLRAARGLLDWTLSDLAEASKLSLSTIRRLEEDADGPLARSRHAVVQALRQAGIAFTIVEGTTLAVAKVA
ncbi:PAS domain-containing protein [Methylobacterium planeticum]|nr:PAS domain-containing protein [Methylobacterium planeticum]